MEIILLISLKSSKFFLLFLKKKNSPYNVDFTIFFFAIFKEKFTLQSVEKREILSHQKIFREINSLVTYLVKPLLSRKICQKCVRENSRNFHTVSQLFPHCVAQCGNCGNLLSLFFDKNSKKVTYFHNVLCGLTKNSRSLTNIP